MQNIDFLPERYRERDLNRKAAAWQYALLLGFGGLLMAATAGQFVIKRSLEASVVELKQPCIDAKLKREQVKLLEKRLGNKEDVAALYTYLRHPWPRTQILSRITNPVPESVTLAGIEILQQQPNRSAISKSERRDDKQAGSATTDLKDLQSSNDAARVIVRVRGTVSNTAALNEYVRQLGESPLFRNVSISSLQSQTAGDKTLTSAFELTVVILPGHGQPGAPNGPIVQRDKLASNLRVGGIE